MLHFALCVSLLCVRFSSLRLRVLFFARVLYFAPRASLRYVCFTSLHFLYFATCDSLRFVFSTWLRGHHFAARASLRFVCFASPCLLHFAECASFCYVCCTAPRVLHFASCTALRCTDSRNYPRRLFLHSPQCINSVASSSFSRSIPFLHRLHFVPSSTPLHPFASACIHLYLAHLLQFC